MTRQEEAAERRKGIVQLLKRKELMGSGDIGAQLGISQATLFRDLDALREEGLLVKEGQSRKARWRLSSKERVASRGAPVGTVKEVQADGSVVVEVGTNGLERLRQVIREKKAEITILESALAIAEGA